MNEIIPLSRPDINEEDISQVVRVLKTGLLVQGIEVQNLEKAVSNLFEWAKTNFMQYPLPVKHLLIIK